MGPRTFPLLLLLFATGLFGQRITSEIAGTITDPSSAAVPNAQLTVLDENTKRRLDVKSDDAGAYRVVGLSPGTFEITVEAAGFRTEKRTGVILDVGQVLRL